MNKLYAVRVTYRDGSSTVFGPVRSRQEARRLLGQVVGPTATGTVLRWNAPDTGTGGVLSHRSAPSVAAAPVEPEEPQGNRQGYTIVSTNNLGSNRGGFDVVKDAAGRFLVAAEINDATQDSGLWRFDEDGVLDETFAGTGLIEVPEGDYSANVGVAVLPDNSVFLASRNKIRKYDATGTLDPSWGVGGVVTTVPMVPSAVSGPGDSDVGTGSLFVESDGKVVYTHAEYTVAEGGLGEVIRMDTDGTVLDTVPFANGNFYNAVQVADGQYTLLLRNGNDNTGYIVEVDLDAETTNILHTFVLDTYPFPDPDVPISGFRGGFIRDEDGNYFVVAKNGVADEGTIWKVLPGGALDPNFGTAGIVRYQYDDVGAENYLEFTTAAALPGGDIFVVAFAGGAGGLYLVTGRLSGVDGSPVPTYGTNGWQLDTISSYPDQMAYDCMLDGDGVVLTGYSYETTPTTGAFTWIGRKLIADGTWDANFGATA